MKSGDRLVARQLFIERTKHREGPPIVYTVSNGLTSRLFTDNKRMLEFIRWPRSTPTGMAIREWLASFEQKQEAPAPKLNMAQLQREGFGPEAHDEKSIDPITGEEIPDDPITGTKMVI